MFALDRCLLFLIGCCSLIAVSLECNDGSESRVGFAIYKCLDGKWIPVACALQNGQRLSIDDKAVVGSYELQCIRQDDSMTSLKPVACLSNGRRLIPGETLTTPNFWYTCMSSQNSMSLEVSGCVDEQGQRIAPGGEFNRGHFVFRCVKQDDQVKTEGVACMNGGQRVPVDGTFVRGNFWHQCTRNADDIRVDLKGCAVDGRMLFDNDKYTKNGFVFQCKVTKRNCVGCNDLTSTVEHTLVSCASTDSNGVSQEHPIGGRWVEPGNLPNFKFVIECQKNGNQIKKQVVQCVYATGSTGEANLDPGCARKVGSQLIGCDRGPNDTVTIHTVASKDDDSDLRIVHKMGLRYC